MVETDPQEFNCDTCEVAEAMDGLGGENKRAWGLFHHCCSRFAIDTRATGHILSEALREDDEETRQHMLTRVAMIYDRFFPRRKQARDGA